MECNVLKCCGVDRAANSAVSVLPRLKQRMSSRRSLCPAVSLCDSSPQSGTRRWPTWTLWSAPSPTSSGAMRTWRASWRALRRSVELRLDLVWCCRRASPKTVRHSPPASAERRGAEEVCTGLPDSHQAGGAALPDAEGACWGETGQVSFMSRELTLCRVRHTHTVGVLCVQCVSYKDLNGISSMCSVVCSNRANEEIAQVRAKANAEGVALNASLRKEQMKAESLERAVLQKVRGTFITPETFLRLKPQPTNSSSPSTPPFFIRTKII